MLVPSKQDRITSIGEPVLLKSSVSGRTEGG